MGGEEGSGSVLAAAPPSGLGRRLGPDAPLATLTLGGLLALSSLDRRLGRHLLLGGAVRRRGLDLGRGGGCCSGRRRRRRLLLLLLLDDLLLHHLSRGRPRRNHLDLGRGGGVGGGLGQGHGLGLDLHGEAGVSRGQRGSAGVAVWTTNSFLMPTLLYGLMVLKGAVKNNQGVISRVIKVKGHKVKVRVVFIFRFQ